MSTYHIEKIFLKLFIFIAIAYFYRQPRRLFGKMKTPHSDNFPFYGPLNLF